jgi:putative hemolysin
LVKETILSGVENYKYSIKIAVTEEEVIAAQKLRYRVFGLELKRPFHFTNGMDIDEYDDQCHHLIVIDKETSKIVGTYRLQTYEQAVEGYGFYTSKRFMIDQLPDSVKKNGFEVGRACIENGHRNGRVLYLLWKGLAGYLHYFNKRYMFGYSALDTSDPDIALNTYYYLEKNNYLHPEYFVEVQEKYLCQNMNNSGVNGNIDVPSLLQNYLDVGTRICSLPACDPRYELIHFFILLDIENISERTRKMFFG